MSAGPFPDYDDEADGAPVCPRCSEECHFCAPDFVEEDG